MPKFYIYLLALLSFYCYGIHIFKPTYSKDKVNDQNVRLGEEFNVEIVSDSIFEPVIFLNKDEVSDSIQFLRREVVSFIGGASFERPTRRYKYNFYFKAIKVTNEAKILKFNYTLRREKFFKNYIIKVNAY